MLRTLAAAEWNRDELRDEATSNNLVDQLSTFTDEVTRVASEVGTEGKLGGQARVRGMSGSWKDLTDSVNTMAYRLTAQVRDIALVTTAVATVAVLIAVLSLASVAEAAPGTTSPGDFRLVAGPVAGGAHEPGQPFALQVHIGVQGSDRAIRVCDRLRPVLPTLLAISANCSVWFASFRPFTNCGTPSAAWPPNAAKRAMRQLGVE